MAHQVVATSVPRGLDGVSGYQTVLKSAGIPPRLFDRLKARSGYSHRYPHGDSRNPVVFIHRIEELGGSRWHVLGCIRDAGSDHTGRSNFLAHMVGIDSNEARTKPGGPAAAAIARGCFLEKWNGPPEPAAPPKTLVAADRPPQPGDAPAWKAAGLDIGLAGDLAAAAMANKKVVLVTRPGDDVLALFVDALRLVEPSKRWGVTFNTCAIEDFDGTWKAIRSDLIDAKDMRDGKADLIDLTSSPRSSGDSYARFARGESDSLPWQKPASPAETEPDNAALPLNEPSKAIAPRHEAKEPTRSQKKGARTAAQRSRRERRPRYEEEEETHGSPWLAVAVAAGILLLLGGLAVIPFRDQLLAVVRTPSAEPIRPRNDLVPKPVNVPSSDGIDDRKYEMATKLKEARGRLEAGHGGLTNGALQQKATATLERIETLRRAWPQIFEKDGQDFDPTAEATRVINTCEQVATCLEVYGSVKLTEVQKALEEVLKAEGEFEAAVVSLGKLQKKLDDLESDAKRRQAAMQADERKKRMHQAFQNFCLIGKTVSLPVVAAATSTDLGGVPRNTSEKVTEVKLGTFPFADLVEPRLRLAVPRDTIGATQFKAELVRDETAVDLTWDVLYVPSAVGVDGGKPPQPLRLATLVIRDQQLFFRLLDVNTAASPHFALLRRSVILVEAKDPESPDAPPHVQEIRLVEPTKVGPLEIDLFGPRRQEIVISPPLGITRSVRATNGESVKAKLPISSIRVKAEFFRGDNAHGEEVILEFPDEKEDPAAPGIKKWERAVVDYRPDADLAIQASVALSLPQATLAVTTELVGRGAAWFGKKEKQKKNVQLFFIKSPEAKLRTTKATFANTVNAIAGVRLGQAKTWPGPEKLKELFARPTTVAERDGMEIPAHETMEKSFDKFLADTYAEAVKKQEEKSGKDKGPAEAPDIPKNFDDFVNRCQRARSDGWWDKVYTQPISDWSRWFLQMYEEQWNEKVRLFRGAIDEQHGIRITEIASLAYDESGAAYEVPLVICDAALRSDASQVDDGNPDDKPVGKAGDEFEHATENPPDRPANTGAVGLE